jgi:prepilin-type processing-associated H-X9-DG protein
MKRRASGTSRGFTMIELLVVISITMVLFALLLPAVQQTREAARRITCVNHLAQLGLALQHYQSEHQTFPPGVVDGAGPIVNKPLGYHMSWIVQVLPEIEQGVSYNRLNFAYGAYAAENMTTSNVRYDILGCPSETYRLGEPTGEPEDIPSLIDYEQSNYAGCHNDTEKRIGRKDRGVLYLNSCIRPEDVSDGTSQTILLGEKKVHLGGLGWMSGTRATLRNSGIRPNTSANGALGQTLSFVDDVPSEGPNPDEVVKLPDGRVTFRSLVDPVGGFSSRHPGGANVSFADGSVRFLKDTIATSVMTLLGNRADGELLDSSSY